MAERTTAFWVWLALLAATLANWLLVEADAAAFGRIVLGVAVIKVRLVIRHFMEVADAPLTLGRLLDGWLLIVVVSLLAWTW